jgi:hypothetical protein
MKQAINTNVKTVGISGWASGRRCSQRSGASEACSLYPGVIIV